MSATKVEGSRKFGNWTRRRWIAIVFVGMLVVSFIIFLIHREAMYKKEDLGSHQDAGRFIVQYDQPLVKSDHVKWGRVRVLEDRETGNLYVWVWSEYGGGLAPMSQRQPHLRLEKE